MFKKAYSHVRANVVGYAALFIALGGTAAAATGLPRNSVGTKQIRNGAVTGEKVARHSLTGASIKASTLDRPTVRPTPSAPLATTRSASN